MAEELDASVICLGEKEQSIIVISDGEADEKETNNNKEILEAAASTKEVSHAASDTQKRSDTFGKETHLGCALASQSEFEGEAESLPSSTYGSQIDHFKLPEKKIQIHNSDSIQILEVISPLDFQVGLLSCVYY